MSRVSSSQAAATATATSTTAKAATAATFTCHVCSRAFNRRDHLARHERAHSKSRPFCCGLCGRRFGRHDVLLRHSSHVHQGQRPCEYEDAHVDGAQQRLITYPPSSSSASNLSSEGLGAVTEDEHLTATEHLEPTREDRESMTEYAASTDSSSSSADIDPGLSRVAAFDESELDAFLGLLLGMPSYSDVAETLRQGPPYRQHTLSRAISHRSGDRNSLAAPPQQRPASLSRHPGPAVGNITHPLPSFHRGLFPAEEPASPLSRVRLMPHPVPYLTQSTFDRLIQSYKRHSATIRPFLHFPTLDISLHVLTGKGAPSTLAHSPSCAGWKRKPHRCLLLSILALGAICDQRGASALEIYHETRREILSWLAAVQKLGFEGAPPLELIQAFINYVCCGTKFGDKSIEDLTISHSVSLRSLVLAMGLEESGSRPLVCAQSTCPSCSIDVTVEWLDWVHYEERKRTFLAYFALMSSTLTYLDTITSVGWRGVKHRLPCSDDVWAANSPLSWRSAFQSKPLPPLFAPEVEALFAVYSGRSPASASTSPEVSTTSATARKVGQTSEPRDDYSCFILIAAVYRETWLQSLHNKLDTNATQTALQQWQAKWLRLAPHWGSQPWTPLLACSLAMFDNTQILLHLDIKEAKEALLSRDYGRFCVTLPAFNLRLDSEGSGCSLLSGPDDWQQTRDIFSSVGRRAAFRHIALYSVNALELTFKIHSKSTSDGTKFTFGPHTGTSILYCIQVLTSWICFFSNCLNQGLYLNFLDGPGSSEERQDICLVGKVLAFARNRNIQFNAMLDVPSSPEMLGGLRAGRLASDLLELHSQMFHRCGTWPAFNHLGNALKARSTIISSWLDPDGDGDFRRLALMGGG